MSSDKDRKVMLRTEILDFPPELLLDDVVDICSNTSIEAANAMEHMLELWSSDPSSHRKPHTDQEINEECRDGLAVFESLVLSRSDTAVDSFETWCMRNVFEIPADLPYVLPQHEGADFTATEERESELLSEVDSLRRKIQEQRILKRQLVKARRVATIQRREAEQRLQSVSFLLSNDALNSLHTLPTLLPQMYEALEKLPPLDDATLQFLASCAGNHPGQRPWETSKTGYQNWAVAQLMNRAKEQNIVKGSVDEMAEQAAQVGSPDELREALDIVEATRESLGGLRSRRDEDVDMA